jgi:hypothetical protein
MGKKMIIKFELNKPVTVKLASATPSEPEGQYGHRYWDVEGGDRFRVTDTMISRMAQLGVVVGDEITITKIPHPKNPSWTVFNIEKVGGTSSTPPKPQSNNDMALIKEALKVLNSKLNEILEILKT